MIPLLALACGGGSAAVDAARDGAVEVSADTAPDADTAAILPGCRLRFRNIAANLTAPEVVMVGACPGERTDDGMGHPFIDFQPSDMQIGVVRAFSIWQFQTQAPTGTTLKVEDGFDELAGRGVSVRYLEIQADRTNIWRADRGVVTLVSTKDEAYALDLAGVHLVPAPDPSGTNRAMGDFEVNGSVVSVLP